MIASLPLRLAAALCVVASGIAPARAGDFAAFAGTWIIQGSTIAPWADPQRPIAPDEPRRLVGKTVVFGPARVTGPAPIGCAKPVYKVEDSGPDMLFEGMLAEPRRGRPAPDAVAAATKLGFVNPTLITTLDAGCTELQFHQLAPGRLAFGLNDRVYTLVRK